MYVHKNVKYIREKETTNTNKITVKKNEWNIWKKYPKRESNSCSLNINRGVQDSKEFRKTMEGAVLKLAI
jgi:hypothetical protein